MRELVPCGQKDGFFSLTRSRGGWVPLSQQLGAAWWSWMEQRTCRLLVYNNIYSSFFWFNISLTSVISQYVQVIIAAGRMSRERKGKQRKEGTGRRGDEARSAVHRSHAFPWAFLMGLILGTHMELGTRTHGGDSISPFPALTVTADSIPSIQPTSQVDCLCCDFWTFWIAWTTGIVVTNPRGSELKIIKKNGGDSGREAEFRVSEFVIT